MEVTTVAMKTDRRVEREFFLILDILSALRRIQIWLGQSKNSRSDPRVRCSQLNDKVERQTIVWATNEWKEGRLGFKPLRTADFKNLKLVTEAVRSGCIRTESISLSTRLAL